MKITKEIKNILFTRLLFTLGILLLIRVGTFLPIPGINQSDLVFYIQRHSVAKNLLSTFSGDFFTPEKKSEDYAKELFSSK